MSNPLPRIPLRRLALAGAGALALGGVVTAAAATSDAPERAPISVELAADGSHTSTSSDDSAPDTTLGSTPTSVDDTTSSSTPVTVDDDEDDDDTTSTSTPGDDDQGDDEDDDDTTSTSTPGDDDEDDDDVAVAPFVRSYALVGGTVTVGFDGTALRLDAVSPAPGFTADVEHGGGDTVEVRFEGPVHESRLKVDLHDGAVREEVEERPSNSGPGSTGDDDVTPTTVDDDVTPTTIDDDGDDDGDNSGPGSGSDDDADDHSGSGSGSDD